MRTATTAPVRSLYNSISVHRRQIGIGYFRYLHNLLGVSPPITLDAPSDRSIYLLSSRTTAATRPWVGASAIESSSVNRDDLECNRRLAVHARPLGEASRPLVASVRGGISERTVLAFVGARNRRERSENLLHLKIFSIFPSLKTHLIIDPIEIPGNPVPSLCR